MAYRKVDLFRIPKILPKDRTPIANADRFPPAEIKWKSGETFICLGASNKDDLLKVDLFADDAEVMKAFHQNLVGQFLYTDESAELFEVMIIQNEASEMYITAIRTRRKA
jgi:hypothetical protein